ncbi:MAG: TetR/AcrR family transcriptional regulator [Bacteroidia bacterium]
MQVSKRKAEILTVSAKMFRERGFNAVSMRDIAAELDMKAASLYNHISSKQEILELIIIEIAEEFTDGMKEISSSDLKLTEKLKAIIDLHVDLTLRDPDEMACVNNDWMHLAEARQKYFLQMRHEYELHFTQLLEAGMAEGEIRIMDTDVAMFAFLSTLRTLHLRYGKRRKVKAELLKHNLYEVLVNGLATHH